MYHYVSFNDTDYYGQVVWQTGFVWFGTRPQLRSATYTGRVPGTRILYSYIAAVV